MLLGKRRSTHGKALHRVNYVHHRSITSSSLRRRAAFLSHDALDVLTTLKTQLLARSVSDTARNQEATGL